MEHTSETSRNLILCTHEPKDITKDLNQQCNTDLKQTQQECERRRPSYCRIFYAEQEK